MKNRFTINQLTKPDHKEYLNDVRLLKALVNERLSEVTNPHAPLANRLEELNSKLGMLNHADVNEIPVPAPPIPRLFIVVVSVVKNKLTSVVHEIINNSRVFLFELEYSYGSHAGHETMAVRELVKRNILPKNALNDGDYISGTRDFNMMVVTADSRGQVYLSQL